MTQDVSPDFSDALGKNSQGQILDLKKRARRRLVGAVALVLLMLALLPMVLDDKRTKPAPQEIAISIPSQDDAGFSSKVIPAAPASVNKIPLPEASEMTLQQPPSKTENTPPVEKSALPTIDKTPNPSAKSKPDEVSSLSNMPAQKNESVAVPNPSATNVASKRKADPEQTSNPRQKSAPLKTVEDKSQLAKDSPAASGKSYSVQVGVFSDAAKVEEIQKKLQAHDVTSTSTEKIMTDKGEKIRLRAGTFSDRQDAEHLLTKVREAGFSGMVVSK